MEMTEVNREFSIVIKARLQLNAGDFDADNEDDVAEMKDAVIEAGNGAEVEASIALGEDDETTTFVLMIDDVTLA
jgi:hypothetical protein